MTFGKGSILGAHFTTMGLDTGANVHRVADPFSVKVPQAVFVVVRVGCAQLVQDKLTPAPPGVIDQV